MEIPIPFNEDAELAVIGSVITNPDCLDSLELLPEDFYIQRNRWIWEAICNLRIRRIRPDYITLLDELEKTNKFQEIGGDAFIVSAISASPSFLNVENYAEIVREDAARRNVIENAQALVKAALDTRMPVREGITSIIAKLAAPSISDKSGAQHWKEGLSKLYDDVEKRSKNPKDIWGIPTFFIDIDAATGGGQPGELWLLAGPPGTGKSILGVQMIIQACAGRKMFGGGERKNQRPAVIYDLEMTEMALARRAVSGMTHIPTRKFKTGDMDENDWRVFTMALDDATANIPLYISDKSNWTPTDLFADISRCKALYGIEMVLVDYLSLMTTKETGLKDYEKSAIISTILKQIAKETGVWVVGIESMTKEGMKQETPDQSDISGSGKTIHNADLIMFLSRVTQDDADRFDAELLKIPSGQFENIRRISFGKGRELEQDRSKLYLSKFEKFAAFEDFTLGS